MKIRRYRTRIPWFHPKYIDNLCVHSDPSKYFPSIPVRKANEDFKYQMDDFEILNPVISESEHGPSLADEEEEWYWAAVADGLFDDFPYDSSFPLEDDFDDPADDVLDYFDDFDDF